MAGKTKTTLVKCGWLISLDERIGDLRNTEILIKDGRIADIGQSLEAEADEVVDATGKIAAPGLVNAHIHTWQIGMRSVGAEWLGADYHRNMHGHMATFYTAEDAYLGTLYGALCQINAGVTTIYDWCHVLRDLEMAERALDGLEESGIRALFGHGTAKPPLDKSAGGDGVPYSRIPHPRARVEHLRTHRIPGDDGKIGLAMAILGPEYGTLEVAETDLRLARELGLMTTAHLWHGHNRQDDGEHGDPYGPLADKGLLGPDHNVVHANYISDDQLKRLVDHGVTITSTVLVELHGHGAEPLTGRVRDLGVTPSIGIDTALIVTDDMLSEMRAAQIALRYRHHQADYQSGDYPPARMPVTSREALQWTTISNAKVMGLDHKIGSLTPGKQADLILVDAGSDAIFPVHDPVHALAEYAPAAAITDVMIAGEFHKRDGVLCYPASGLDTLKQQLAEGVRRVMDVAGYQSVAK